MLNNWIGTVEPPPRGEELKKEVSDADKSVTSTSAAQQSLTDKIQNLEKQLKDLQKGMELLRDAIR